MTKVRFLGVLVLALGVLVLAVTNEVRAVPTAPGDPNPYFGGFSTDGILSIGDYSVSDVAIDNNGYLLVVGQDGPDLILERFRLDGSPDSSFGALGRVRLNDVGASQPFDAQMPSSKVAVQADGKVLVASSIESGNDNRDFFLARFRPDGSPDLTFGVNGVRTTDFDGKDDFPNAGVSLQSDGKIVVAGSAVNERTLQFDEYDFAVARYHTDGSLDQGFDGDGKVLVDFDGYSPNDYAYDVTLQPDGKIVVGGRADDSELVPPVTDDDFGVARFNPDGSPDTSFDTDGKVRIGFGADYDRLHALHYLPDGKLLAVGARYDFCCGDEEPTIAVARFLPNGTLDATLDDDGKLSFDVSGLGSRARDVWVQPDGKYLLLVEQDPYGDGIPSLMRLLPDGSLDTSFDDDGVLVFATNGGASDLETQPDGKVVVAGLHDLYRFLPGFRPDTSSQVVTSFGLDDDAVYDVALQQDGKLVTAGEAVPFPGNVDVALARYNPDGTPDAEFGTFGMANFGLAQDEHGRAVAIQPDGKIVVAGYVERSDDDMAVWRFNANGMPDNSFNGLGFKFVDFGQGDDAARAVAVLPDGRILVGGHAEIDSFALMRLEPNGDLDPTFGNDGEVKMFIGIGRIEVRAMLVLPDGRIIVGGFQDSGGSAQGEFVLASFLPDGAMDEDFGSAGTGVVKMGFNDSFGNAYDDVVQALARLPNGLIVATGSSGGDWATVLFQDDGSLATYPFIWPLRTSWTIPASARDIVVQEDGKFIVVGSGINAGEADSRFLLARYRLGGFGPSLDLEFGGGDGRVETSIQERAGAHAVVMKDNELYAAGYSDNGHDFDFAVVKYATDDAEPPPPPELEVVYLPLVANAENW